MASKTERMVVNSAGLVQGIYRKLAANRRGEAVRRARLPELTRLPARAKPPARANLTAGNQPIRRARISGEESGR